MGQALLRTATDMGFDPAFPDILHRPTPLDPNGGTSPRWRSDGPAIFYRELDGRAVAAVRASWRGIRDLEHYAALRDAQSEFVVVALT